MKLFDIITIIQVLAGALILLLSVPGGLKIRKDCARDVQGKWLAVISFMVFFFICYLLFVLVVLFDRDFPVTIITGSVFLGGACFVYLIIRITETTNRHKNSQTRELHVYAEKMSENNETLKKLNEELWQDISQRKLSEETLRKSERKYSSLVESTEDSIYLIDRDYRYLFINKRHLSRMGVSEDAYRGKRYNDFHTSEEAERFTEIIEKVFSTGESIQLERKSRRDDNYFLLTLSPVFETDGEITAVTVISKKITELKQLQEELRNLTLTDPLTGLYNRRGFLTLAEQHLKIAGRTKATVFMLYADLDDLKYINDNFGHQDGDSALKETARIFKETFRESDIIARIGGDEFAVLPIGNTAESASILTTRLKNNLVNFNKKKSHNYTLSISIGIAHYDPAHTVSVEELLNQGDRLMYEDKLRKKKP